MDLIEEIKLEFNGIRDTIYEYTDKGDIKNYLTNLEKALEENHIDRIKYSINKIYVWYSENIYKILSNEYVYNGETHKSYIKLLERYKSEIDTYNPTNQTKTISTSSDKKKIFISHASADKEIGDALLELLINLGVKKEDVFYSSKYHFGVELGKDFNQIVKDNLIRANITIFLLTNDFYTSEYCMHEMGAVWILGKKFIPILLDGLTYQDMKGFIDARNIAIEAELTKLDKFHSYLKMHYGLDNSLKGAEICFQKFCEKVKKAINKKPIKNSEENIKTANYIILEKKITEEELLLLSFFIENQTDRFNEDDQNDKDFQNWSASVSRLNLEKAKMLLSKFDWFKINNNWKGYFGCELDHNFFRELLQLSPDALKLVQDVAAKRKKHNP